MYTLKKQITLSHTKRCTGNRNFTNEFMSVSPNKQMPSTAIQ